jgi:hypothetical protein
MRREAVFDAAARDPAEPCVEDLLVVADGGRIDEALAGEGQSAGGVEQP